MTEPPEPRIPPCQIIATREGTSPVWRFFLVNTGDGPIERAVLAAVKYEWGDQYWGEGESPGVEVVDLLPGDRALIWEDDGTGIPAEEKERIFHRGVGKNTGLGLFLIREILGITGIGITETGEPGAGARFEMRVPRGAWQIAVTQPSSA